MTAAVDNAMRFPIVERLCEPDSERAISQVTKRKILAVDDDSQVRRLIFKVLNCEEYDVACVSSSEEAIRTTDEINPCLILLDLHLSPNEQFEGFECLRELRRSGFKGSIYILSADENFAQAHKAARFGADGYFVKRGTRTFWSRLKDLIQATMHGIRTENEDLSPAAIAYLKTRGLTDTDIRLLEMFSSDYGREKEMSRILDCSEYSIRKKFQSIRDRLGARSQADLARMIGVLSCF